MKHYCKKFPISNFQFPNKFQIQNPKLRILNIYHIDSYRVRAKDILALGWEEIIRDKSSIIIIEWADRIRKIIPEKAIWVKFRWLGKNQREVEIEKSKPK
jgi:tRNA A37 threonylcarbamoyladenosine biosynthesis protein TsaE